MKDVAKDKNKQINNPHLIKSLFLYFGKFILASIVAVLILSLLFSGYYLVPLRVENPDQNTDYKWESNAPWVRMEEGISVGQFDANGFNNAQVVSNPDVLILGSSHMEAVNVPQDQNTGYYLSQSLDGKLSVYNMGISGHTFAKICQYLPQTMQMYETVPKYTVIETSSTEISDNDAKAILNLTVPKTSVSHNSILNLLQRSPFFRVVYYQLDGGLIKKLSDARGSQTITYTKSDKTEDDPEKTDRTPYSEVFEYLQGIQKEYHTQIILLYHPTEQLNSDGTVTYPQDATFKIFADEAKAHDLTFVDTTEAFTKLYEDEYQLPHGFINGKLGEGHLNGYGHDAVAESLSEVILNFEEAKDADN